MKIIIATFLAVVSLSAAAGTCHFRLVISSESKQIETRFYYDTWQRNDCIQKALKSCERSKQKVIGLGHYYDDELACIARRGMN